MLKAYATHCLFARPEVSCHKEEEKTVCEQGLASSGIREDRKIMSPFSNQVLVSQNLGFGHVGGCCISPITTLIVAISQCLSLAGGVEVTPWKCEEGQSICCNPRMKESFYLRCALAGTDTRLLLSREMLCCMGLVAELEVHAELNLSRYSSVSSCLQSFPKLSS